MSTVRRALVLGTLAIIAAMLAALAVADPFHLRHAGWFTAGLVLLTLVLATVAVAVAVRFTVLRALVLLLGGALSVGWLVIVWTLIGLGDPDRPVVAEVDSGYRRLVILEGSAFAIDPVYRVVLRSGDGPFEQESLVWQGFEEGPSPGEVAFRGGDEVQVRAGSCVYVSRIEAVTLAVDPVHRPERLDGC